MSSKLLTTRDTVVIDAYSNNVVIQVTITRQASNALDAWLLMKAQIEREIRKAITEEENQIKSNQQFCNP